MKSNAFELHNYAATPIYDITSNSSGGVGGGIGIGGIQIVNSNNNTMKSKGSNSNNNSCSSSNRRNEKYSLRQRQKRRNARTQLEEPIIDVVNNELIATPTILGTNYVTTIQKTTATTKQANVKATTKTTSKTKTTKMTTTTTTTTTPSTTLATPAKAKTKAAPLSKYRRKTANARERTRMREINTAFETLRYSVPQAITGDDPSSTNEKLTKITTLRLAMRYINLLSETLENNGPTTNDKREFLLECLRDSSERQRRSEVAMAAAAATATAVDEETFMDTTPTTTTITTSLTTTLLPTTKTTNSKSKTKTKCSNKKTATATTTPTATTKRQSKKQQQKQQQQQQQEQQQQLLLHQQQQQQQLSPLAKSRLMHSPESAYSSSGGICSPPFSTNGLSAAASPSSAYTSLSAHSYSSTSSSSSSSSTPDIVSAVNQLYNTNETSNLLDVHALELNTLLLESDADSLHLSDEHCLSPSYSSLLGGVCGTAMVPLSTSSLSSASPSSIQQQQQQQQDVELSLRLLDSNAAGAFDAFVGDSGVVIDAQQPSACLSPPLPLTPFDSFANFSDLLEHNALDLFLT